MMQSVREVAALAPESISLHALCKKRTSELSCGDVYATQTDVSGLQDRARIFLREAQYAPYYLYRQKYAAGLAENVGYARSGAACVYNIRMMGETQTVFSAGAHATTKLYFRDKDAFVSVFMPKDIARYISDIKRLTQKKCARMQDAASCGRL
jgi:oxygen-independent coproporphyrinogen-3 oxidase